MSMHLPQDSGIALVSEALDVVETCVFWDWVAGSVPCWVW